MGIGIAGTTRTGIGTDGIPGSAYPPMLGIGGGDGMVGSVGIGIEGGTSAGIGMVGTPGSGYPPMLGMGGGDGIAGRVGIGIDGGTRPGTAGNANAHLVIRPSAFAFHRTR